MIRPVGINRRQFLISGAIPGLVGTCVIQSAGHLHRPAIQPENAFKRAFPRRVFQRPDHRDALDMNRLAVVAMRNHFGTVAKAVSRLNRIPAQSLPVGLDFLARRDKRIRPGIKRHLNLPSPVVAVDQIFAGLGIGQIRHRTPEIQIHAQLNLPIIQPAHLFGSVLLLGKAYRRYHHDTAA